MVPSGPVRLRYFDCRSRGQALRFALADAGVPFDDVRVPVEELERFRENAHRPEVGGPFGSLPVLEWRGTVVAQTLAIARFLAGQLDEPVGADAQALRDMLANAAHLDMQVPYSQLLWLPADVPGDELEARADALRAHLVRKSEQVDTLLPSHGFLGGPRPCVAEHVIYESVSRALAVFGARYRHALDGLPRLRELHEAVEARPAIRALVRADAIPYAVTASPSERTLRARISQSR